MGNNKMYRYIDTLYSSGDEDYGYRTYVKVQLLEYNIISKTPKGTWIGYFCTKDRFVLDKARKKFAHPTKEEAMESFIARKQAQVRIIKTQLKHVQNALMQVGAIHNDN